MTILSVETTSISSAMTFSAVPPVVVSLPVELALPFLGRAPWAPVVHGAATVGARLWPTMFGYQFVHEAIPG